MLKKDIHTSMQYVFVSSCIVFVPSNRSSLSICFFFLLISLFHSVVHERNALKLTVYRCVQSLHVFFFLLLFVFCYYSSRMTTTHCTYMDFYSMQLYWFSVLSSLYYILHLFGKCTFISRPGIMRT